MKIPDLKYSLALGFAGFVFLACSGGEGGGSTSSPTPDFTVAPLISECGGFVAAGTAPKIPKPDPATYLGAARVFDLEPHEAMLVAAHQDDLDAARACGLHTIIAVIDSQ